MAVTDFVLDTDYPVDKVVLQISGSAVMDGSTTINVPYTLPFVPLIDLIWSYTPDFSISYSNNSGPAPASVPGYLFDFYLNYDTKASTITLYGNGPATAKTVYYRIFGVQPDNSNAVVASTVAAGDTFVYNTDDNYTKLFMAGNYALTSGTSTTTITHNIGDYPQVEVWQYNSASGTTGMIDVSDDSGDWIIEVTPTTLLLTKPSFIVGTAYYRIYLDK